MLKPGESIRLRELPLERRKFATELRMTPAFLNAKLTRDEDAVSFLADEMYFRLEASLMCREWRRDDVALVPASWFDHLKQTLIRRFPRLFHRLRVRMEQIPVVWKAYNLCPHMDDPERTRHYEFLMSEAFRDVVRGRGEEAGDE